MISQVWILWTAGTTNGTFEWFLSFMNWCNMQIQIIFQTKINFTFVTFEWFFPSWTDAICSFKSGIWSNLALQKEYLKWFFSSWTEVTCSFNSFSTSNWTSHISKKNRGNDFGGWWLFTIHEKVIQNDITTQIHSISFKISDKSNWWKLESSIQK